MYYVYTITNQTNKKQYVGKTHNPEKRWTDHKKGHGSPLVARAIKKYGLEHLNFEVVATFTTEDEAFGEEIRLITELGTKAPAGYNIRNGGAGPKSGYKQTPQHIAKRTAKRQQTIAKNRKRRLQQTRQAIKHAEEQYNRDIRLIKGHLSNVTYYERHLFLRSLIDLFNTINTLHKYIQHAKRYTPSTPRAHLKHQLSIVELDNSKQTLILFLLLTAASIQDCIDAVKE